jgi:hypothetical protein
MSKKMFLHYNTFAVVGVAQQSIPMGIYPNDKYPLAHTEMERLVREGFGEWYDETKCLEIPDDSALINMPPRIVTKLAEAEEVIEDTPEDTPHVTPIVISTVSPLVTPEEKVPINAIKVPDVDLSLPKKSTKETTKKKTNKKAGKKK